VKKDARQWGFFAILLTAVLASGDGGGTTVLVREDSTHTHLEVAHFPLSLPDTVRLTGLTDTPLSPLPHMIAADWSIALPSENVGFGMSTPAPALPTTLKSEAANYPASRPGLSEREMAVWKSNDEPEDWLFRMQITRAFDFEEPEPLIPIPEPTSGLLVIMGIAGRVLWGRCAERRGRPTPSI